MLHLPPLRQKGGRLRGHQSDEARGLRRLLLYHAHLLHEAGGLHHAERLRDAAVPGGRERQGLEQLRGVHASCRGTPVPHEAERELRQRRGVLDVGVILGAGGRQRQRSRPLGRQEGPRRRLQRRGLRPHLDCSAVSEPGAQQDDQEEGPHARGMPEASVGARACGLAAHGRRRGDVDCADCGDRSRSGHGGAARNEEVW
mmetsp:Transcript_89791/g.231826  ORF Transcript_89791/g.231826 Transcript_89791/m.231826 type:complete len:200 (-) Transcript_89791:42-641(-)